MASPTDPLHTLASTWRQVVGPARRSLTLAAVALAVVVALLLARQGTLRTRIAGVVVVAVVALLAGVAAYLDRRFFRDPRRIVERLAGRVDPDRAARALRALSLLGPDGDVARPDGVSTELARLHVARAIAALPSRSIHERATRVARRLRLAALVLTTAMAVLALTRPWMVLEGIDVLGAHAGRGLFTMTWLDAPELRARPPEYLHMEERREVPYGAMSLPYGTVLTFRGVPLHEGRHLSLTDGVETVDFVDDGSHGLVARWSLKQEVTLRVVARFGDVLIPEPEATRVRSIADQPPTVSLEGAPRRVMLASEEDDGEVSIRYEAADDHGLREVHLVLRSGTREERRLLARLDGETRFDRGGYVLRTHDPFVKKSHAPVEVRVEAKDNNPLTGPKWGASLPITLVPPDVGEPEARRLDALRKLRDAFVHALADRLGREPPVKGDAEKRAFAAHDTVKDLELTTLADVTFATSFAGLRVPGRLQAHLRGQLRKVHAAVTAQAKEVTSATHAALVKATEKLVLVTDAVVRGMGQRDTRDAAKQLVDTADDLALGASEIARGVEKERGEARMGASADVLRGGGRSMKRLGSLGRDLGEIVATDLLRVARARREDDYPHAELAARDLAARLRQPDPSFGSQGGSGHGGGESGGGRGTPGDEPEEPDEAQQAFNEAAQQIERLAQDHAGNIGAVERELNAAQSSEEMDALKDEAKKHAEAIREAAQGLPSVGAGSESWTSKGSAAREHAEQMAKSLEEGSPADAVQSGKSAMGALDEARRIAQRERWLDPQEGVDKRIEEAKRKLDAEVRWAEKKLEEMRKHAAERASKELEQHGEDEAKMAERAQKIGETGRGSGALPEQALQSLEDAERAAHEAAEALKKGEADKALEKQREAQQRLEMAKQALGEQKDESGQQGGDDGAPANDHLDIPKADAHKGPEEWRRRVMKGLGQPASGRLRDAVRRYAEGLLR